VGPELTGKDTTYSEGFHAALEQLDLTGAG
jgi:hypothetical protein